MKKYDVIVIGAGSAGLGNAGVANTIGLKTLLIEKNEEYFGGDCTNFGCVPSKALIHIAQKFQAAREASAFGLSSSGKADMQKVLAYIHSKQEVIRKEEDADHHRKQGIDVEIGTARFVDRKTVAVNDQEYTARVIMLCTGSSPRILKIPGMEGIPVYTNENIFYECTSLPEHFVIIGGGPIGCEMGQAFQRLGAQVHLVDRGDRLLSKETVKVSEILQTQFVKEGIKIYHKSEVVRIDNNEAILKTNDGERRIPCTALLMAVGRMVNTVDMDLEKAGIELTHRGKIKVDDYLRSTSPNVYIIGDAAGKYMFSHGAEKMVRQLWRNLIIPFFRKKNATRDLSWVTFTDPEVATFGWNEDQMQEHGIKFYRQDQSFSEDDRAIIQSYTYGHVSYWMTSGSRIGNRHLLSGTMIAPHAGDLIQEMQFASENKTSIKRITQRVYPYPVASRINQKTIRGVMEQTYTPWLKKMAATAFRLFHS